MHPNIKHLREGDLLVLNQKDHPTYFNIDSARGKTNVLFKIIRMNDDSFTLNYSGRDYNIKFADISDNYFVNLNKIIGNDYTAISKDTLVEKVLSNLHKKYKTVKIYVDKYGDQCSPADARDITEASFHDDGCISYSGGNHVRFNHASYAGKDIEELPTKIYNLTSTYNTSVNYNTSVVCWANDFQNIIVNHFFQGNSRDKLNNFATSLEKQVKESDMKPDVYTELSKLPKDFKFVLSFKDNPSLLSFYSDRYKNNKKTICTIDSVDPRNKYTVFKAPGIHNLSVEKRWVEKETLESVIPTSWHISDIDLDNIYAKHITKFAKEHDNKIDIYVDKNNRPCPIKDAVEIKEVQLNNINNTLAVMLDDGKTHTISPRCYAGETGALPKIVLDKTENYHTHSMYKNIDVACYSYYDRVLYKNGRPVNGLGSIFQAFENYLRELNGMSFKEKNSNSQTLKDKKEVDQSQLKVGDKFTYRDSDVEFEVLYIPSEGPTYGVLLKSKSSFESQIGKFHLPYTLDSFNNLGWAITKEIYDQIKPNDIISILRPHNGKVNLLLENKTETKIEGDTMTSINDKKAKPAETKESLMSVFAKDFDKAKYRTAATTTTKLARKAMLNFFASKGLSDEKNGKAIAELVDSALGESLMRALVGQALTYAPGIKEDERAKKLAKEFRVSGFATAGDAVFDKIKEIAMPALTSVMASLPTEQTASVAVANTAPQTQLRVVHHEDNSGGDEEESHEETKVSAKKSKKLHHNK